MEGAPDDEKGAYSSILYLSTEC